MSKKSQPIFQKEDVARWVTFGGFWGSMFYILSLLGMIVGHRRQPARVHAPTAITGMGIYVGSFVGFVSIFSALQAIFTRKSSTAMAQERISGGTFEQSVVKLGISSAITSFLPLTAARKSIETAENVTGRPVFDDYEHIDWPRTYGIMGLLSGVTALTVARITSWVARDARSGK